ncbi:MAG TPA: 3'(2'),5'-bisphosphate nucleotidase CysQ [Gemmatimonadales bacterium]
MTAPSSLDHVIDAVQEAGREIAAIAARGFRVEHKGAAGPVTEADRFADTLLRSELPRILPGAWLSEETADDPARLSADALWIVDPLDGTREFTKHIPEYSVSVAYVRRGEPVIGVVHNPVTGDVFTAERGAGAFRNGHRVSVAEGERLLASRSEAGKGEFASLAGVWDLAPVGSIALKLALVAAGEAAVTLSRGPKHEWDVCAGALIVAEAGGVATDVFGGALRYNQPFPKVKGVLAGAPKACARASASLQRVAASPRMAEFETPRRSPQWPPRYL